MTPPPPRYNPPVHDTDRIYTEYYDHIFSDPQRVLERESNAKIFKKEIDALVGSKPGASYRPNINHFLEDEEDENLSSYSRDAILELCLATESGADLGSRTFSPEPSNRSRRAWIDDRSSKIDGDHTHREYLLPMDADTLREILSHDRWPAGGQKTNRPDVDRRLIHIENLDGHFIQALAATALPHGTVALRDAIASFVGAETKFQLDLNVKKSIFRISMHMAFPVRLSEDDKDLSLSTLWTEFDTKHAHPLTGAPPPRLCTSRKVIELCGIGYQKYTVFSFADALPGAEPLYEKDETDFHYDVASPRTIHEDQIALGRSLDANFPIMDAREYMLVQFSIHVRALQTHWRDVVMSHKGPFEAHEQLIRSLPPGNQRLSRQHYPKIVVAQECTQRWESRLEKLENDLLKLISALRSFCEDDGGLDFISRSHSRYNHRRDELRCSKNAIANLEDLHRTLLGWARRCARHSKTLDARVVIEANNRNVDMANVNRVTMQYLPPIMVSVGLCSMNEKFIPFTLNKSGLLFATIVVTLAFLLLQYTVSLYHDNSKWWADLIRTVLDYLHAGRAAIGEVFNRIQLPRAQSVTQPTGTP